MRSITRARAKITRACVIDCLGETIDLAPVVQKVDSAIQWINHCPVDNGIGFVNAYPLDSDLSGR